MPAFTPPTPRSGNQYPVSLHLAAAAGLPTLVTSLLPPCWYAGKMARSRSNVGVCDRPIETQTPEHKKNESCTLCRLTPQRGNRLPMHCVASWMRLHQPSFASLSFQCVDHHQSTHNPTQDQTQHHRDKLLTAAPAEGWAAAASARTCAGAARARRSSPTPS